jgi:hypothetical protein
MRIIRVLRFLALFLGTVTTQAWAEDVRLPVPGGGALVLPVPDGWATTKRSGRVPTVSLTSASGDAFQMLVSPLVAPDGRLAEASPDFLRHSVEDAANQAMSQSVEKSLPIQNFGSGKVQGNYFSATDRAPKPGQYKYLTQGSMSVSGMPVGFTILSSGDAQAVVEPALRMLAAARRQ